MYYERGYRLQFANGLGWRICSTASVKGLWEKFVGILNIKPCNDEELPLFLFCSRESEVRDFFNELKESITVDGHFSQNDWKVLNMDLMTAFTNYRTRDIICKVNRRDTFRDDIYTMWRSMYLLYQHILDSGGSPMHAGLVERGGWGIVFAAPGGAGKSTCCSRLPAGWDVCCDDEVFMLKCGPGDYAAHPLPTWSDMILSESQLSWPVESSIPVKMIFFLKKAERNGITPLGSGKASVLINQSCKQILRRAWFFQNQDIQRKQKVELFNYAAEMAKQVPAYILHLSLMGNFWEEIDILLKSQSGMT